jgi:hypothetical protein
MNDTSSEEHGLIRREPNINGRAIRGFFHPDGKWRWFVGIRGPEVKVMNGPIVKYSHICVLSLAGGTLEEAQTLANKLGPLPEEEDETEKAKSFYSSTEMGYVHSLNRDHT